MSLSECATLKNEKHPNSAVHCWNIFVLHKNVLDSLNYIHAWQLTCSDTCHIWARYVVANSIYSMYKNVDNGGTWFVKPTAITEWGSGLLAKNRWDIYAYTTATMASASGHKAIVLVLMSSDIVDKLKSNKQSNTERRLVSFQSTIMNQMVCFLHYSHSVQWG